MRTFRHVPPSPTAGLMTLPSGIAISGSSAAVDLASNDSEHALRNGWQRVFEIGTTDARVSIGQNEGSMPRFQNHLFLDTDLSLLLFWNYQRKCWVDIAGTVH